MPPVSDSRDRSHRAGVVSRFGTRRPSWHTPGRQRLSAAVAAASSRRGAAASSALRPCVGLGARLASTPPGLRPARSIGRLGQPRLDAAASAQRPAAGSSQRHRRDRLPPSGGRQAVLGPQGLIRRCGFVRRRVVSVGVLRRAGRGGPASGGFARRPARRSVRRRRPARCVRVRRRVRRDTPRAALQVDACSSSRSLVRCRRPPSSYSSMSSSPSPSSPPVQRTVSSPSA